MDVKQLISRLQKMDQDKSVLYIEECGGWDDIEVKEEQHNVYIYCDGGNPFSDDK